MYKLLLLLHEILHTGSKNWRGLFQAFCLIDIPCALTIWSYFCSPIFVFWRCLFWFCFCCCWGFFGGGFGGVQWLYECSFLHTNLLQSHISKLICSFYFTFHYWWFTAISKLQFFILRIGSQKIAFIL